jgi:uncharacterized membrane protein YbhN (UPF0104 family)
MSAQQPQSPARPRLLNAEVGIRLLWVAIGLVVVAAIAIAARGLPWHETWLALIDAPPGLVLAGIFFNFIMFPIWATQWLLLTPRAQRPTWIRMLEIVSLTSLSQNVIPLVGGTATGIGLLILRGGLARGTAISVLAIDQMVTGISKLAALGIAALLVPMPYWLHDGALGFVGVVSAFLVILLILAYSPEQFEKWAQRPGRAARLHATFAVWMRHLGALRRGGGPAWVALAFALAKKAFEVAGALAIQYACGIELGWGAATLVVAALGLSTLLRTPGNLGVFEATAVAIYTALGVPPAPALAAALLHHFVALLPRIGGGLVFLAIKPWLPARPR